MLSPLHGIQDRPTVRRILEPISCISRLCFGNEALVERDFLKAGYLYALTVLQSPHKFAGFEQTLMCTSVKPGIAATDLLYE